MTSPTHSHAADAFLRTPTLPVGPRLFRKMIRPPASSVPNGAYVGLRSRDGELLARGIINRRSTLAFRILGNSDAPSNVAELFALRLRKAHELRVRTLRLPKRTNAWRLVNSEGDDLSGVVVDVYGDLAVASVFSLGYIANGQELERALLRLDGIEKVVFRADKRSEELEGFRLPPVSESLEVPIEEHGVRYRVAPGAGHKTGFFLDQRDNRLLVGRIAFGRRVLDLCTNSGGFALNAALRGKPREVVAVDLDEEVLERARVNARINRVKIGFEHADLFPWLRQSLEAGNQYGLVILDPPKLAQDRKQKSKALRTYADMNTLAMRSTGSEGLMLTCSCTGCVSESEFLGVLQQAAVAAKRKVRVLEIRGAAPDHPIALEFPEGRYLKAVLLQLQ